ncbi:acetyl/propionyl/methylcrotonyl-CoA carboxylase subunit alpha [Enterovirga sp.]|uniref:acetyl/propionyl/methylcrotonyl-CoA carboxylase subunit alpha n=1 Tax=Enterovirga sp. TaxID=2026350 RepID=UPI0026184889|nr:acetyl/propionyl/methylcrotonyl-CoA carboxylase subunit alpha [Enterovirga sp.]MDB5591766.1 carbamoyl-phosphate synthase subunit [Enterovirga sp.]
MLSSVLIANRGEIACRVIRTARRLGIRTVAVYSEADRTALFVREADEAHEIGPAPARDSYLSVDRILDVARRTGVEAIHPGYGFLSERAEFAEACEQAGILFVGPPASAIRAMGLKDAAKALAIGAGVPVVPGYHGSRQDPDFLRQKAYEIGYPVLIKAVAGGGGTGMRRVDKQAEFEAALEGAQREAQASFGDPRVLVEKYVLSPRHVEVQVFADSHGNAVHLFERDCSLQRRHQKVMEEAPAPGLSPEMREAMGQAAVEAARSVGYVGAGTVEFIADARQGLRPDRFYFMEMNTRLQVEHPVTEAITGLDLVEWQFRVASGEPLPLRQEQLRINGHAVEARVYAEDPARGFLPSTGKLWALRFPDNEDGIRVDAGVVSGDEVTPFYDPMIAKIIAHGATRDEALDRLSAALRGTVVAGPRSNTAFLRALCDMPEFRSGRFDTGTIDRNLEALTARSAGDDDRAAALAALRMVARSGPAKGLSDPWDLHDAFQLMGARAVALPVLVDGERRDVRVTWPGPGEIAAESGEVREMLSGTRSERRERGFVDRPDGGVYVLEGGRQILVQPFDPFTADLDHLDGGDVVQAPMHGKLVAVFVAPGDVVIRGQRLAVVEAMKMEHALLAPRDGTVAEVAAEPGQQVSEGGRLITLAPEEG